MGQYVNVFDEVRRAPSGRVQEVERITSKELQEVRTLKNPPDVVRRTLEATCLILGAARSPPRLVAPSWASVQKRLSDAQFLSDVLLYDIASLRNSPDLMAFLSEEYFGSQRQCLTSTGGNVRAARSLVRPTLGAARSSVQGSRQLGLIGGQLSRTGSAILTRALPEPLSYQRVHRASITAAALFGWCVAVLQQAAQEPESKLAATECHQYEFDLTRPAADEGEPRQAKEDAKKAMIEELRRQVREDAEKRAAETERVKKAERAMKQQLDEDARKKQYSLLRNAWSNGQCGAPQYSQMKGGYLEALVSFPLSDDEVSGEQEEAMEMIASTMSMRQGFRLQLIGVGAEIDGVDVTERRLSKLQSFFKSNGIRCTLMGACNASWVRPSWASEGEPLRGVLCRLHVDSNDAELCGHIQGLAVSDPQTKELVKWLKGRFHIIPC